MQVASTSAPARTTATINVGTRPTLEVHLDSAGDRSPAELAATVDTLARVVSSLRAVTPPEQFGPLLESPLQVRLGSRSEPTDANGGATDLYLGGHDPAGGFSRPLHDVTDVVAHEMGHMLWERARAAPRPKHDDPIAPYERALSESFADVVAMVVTGLDPRIGEGGGRVLRTIGRPSADSSTTAKRLLVPTGERRPIEAGYALGEYVSRAFQLAADSVGTSAAFDAWLGAAAIHGDRAQGIAPSEILPSFRAATLAAASDERVADAIDEAWSDAFAPLS